MNSGIKDDMIMNKTLPPMTSKEYIAEKAKNGIITVRFTKVNGEERTMRATLLAEHLPDHVDIEERATRDTSNVLAVWDVEAKGWRSFRIDSVKEVLTEGI